MGLLLLCASTEVCAQGIIFTAAGPVNRSMGGASTAAPIDATGALYWNPASISGMAQSETSVSLDLLFPVHSIESTLGGFTGSTDADAGAFPVPNVGVVQHTKIDGVTFGAGVTTLGGFGTNVPADPTNPILTAPPGGLGQISSSGLFLQIVPVLSVALTEQFSVAAGPTITTGRISLEPFVFDSANADGTYSTGNASRYHWGSGFQVGAFYILDEQWRLGASFKSPVWMEKFEFNGLDENGLPRKLTTDLDLPLILSLGTSYQANEQTLLALDARLIDYGGAEGFGDDPVYDATGALQGLGYSSVFALAAGIQHHVGELLTVRGGYTYNQNPISNAESFFNMGSPVIYEHMFSGGASLNFSESFSANLAYSYYLENDRTGPIVLPGIGAVPGSSLTNELSAHIFSFGFTMRK